MTEKELIKLAEQVLVLAEKATPRPWEFGANVPFYVDIRKPAPSLSKHDSQRHTYWAYDDGQFAALAMNSAEVLAKALLELKEQSSEWERLANEWRADYDELKNKHEPMVAVTSDTKKEQIKVVLKKISSNHNNLRTDEIIGITHELPVVGQRLGLVGVGLEFGSRLVSTSPVVEIIQQTDKLVEFKTANSHYSLEIL